MLFPSKSYLENGGKSRYWHANEFCHNFQVMSEDITHTQAYHCKHNHRQKYTNWPVVDEFVGFCGPTTTESEHILKELLICAIRFQLFMNHFNTCMYRVPYFNFHIKISQKI